MVHLLTVKLSSLPLFPFTSFLCQMVHIDINESPQERVTLCFLPRLIFIFTLKISLLACIGFWMCVPLTGTRVYILVGESCANELFYLIKKKKKANPEERLLKPLKSLWRWCTHGWFNMNFLARRCHREHPKRCSLPCLYLPRITKSSFKESQILRTREIHAWRRP